jgi:hypothetical protein
MERQALTEKRKWGPDRGKTLFPFLVSRSGVLYQTVHGWRPWRGLRLAGGVCLCVQDEMQSISPQIDFHDNRRKSPLRHPRPYTNPANLAKPTTHVTSVNELTSKSKFAKHAILSANLPSMQTCPAVTTLLGISRAPTSVVRIRAQKKSALARRKHRIEIAEGTLPFFAGQARPYRVPRRYLLTAERDSRGWRVSVNRPGRH